MTRHEAPERVPDWLLGGHVRRRVFEQLRSRDGWTAPDLADEINAGQATVYDVFRALKPLGALEPTGPRGAYRLTRSGVGKAIRELLSAGAAFEQDAVSRAPGRVKRQ
jgi:predicted transcriptional regulator